MELKVLGAFAVLITCGVNSSGASLDRVRVDGGEVKGTVGSGVAAFKGIPFAAPPVGNNRWRAPQPAPAWRGVRSAAEYGPDCMQLPFPSDAAPLGTKPQEDCLYVNVWAPAAKSSKLPVMVWIYGGGFVNGGSSPAVYAGNKFAERGVILVSFNYRVGRFGFFAHPALTAETPAGPLGNYAYLDQIAALKWVQRNIAAFGGDPGNVTLFGESAGGGSVLAMLTSPLAVGLFHKAIIESGGGRAGLGHMPKLDEAEATGLAFATDAGVTGTDAGSLRRLRELPAERLVNGLNMASMFAQAKTYSGPMIDGKIVLETPEQAFLAGHAMKIPVMAGANSQDIGFSQAKTIDELFAAFGADRDAATSAYDPKNSADLRALGPLVAADSMMVEPARFVVRQAAAAGQHAYEFRFAYVAESMRKEWPGAPHATEIPFVFDTVKARYGKNLTSRDEAAAQAANAYWVAFAKTGDPNGQGRPHWPAYDANADVLMNFTNDGPVAEADQWKNRLDLTERLAGAAKHQ